MTHDEIIEALAEIAAYFYERFKVLEWTTFGANYNRWQRGCWKEAKKMGDLIDRDELLEVLGDHVTSVSVCATASEARAKTDMKHICIEDVRNAPAVDAAPVVHGRWVRTDSDTTSAIEYSCSICGDRAPMGYMRQNAKTEYCPHCGARMDA